MLRGIGRRARGALGAVAGALGGRRQTSAPVDDAYTQELLATVWAPHPVQRLTVGGQEFVIGVELDTPETNPREHLVVYKTPLMVQRYQELAASIPGRRIVELGVLWGGGAALMFQLFQPDTLIAFDLDPMERPALDRFVTTHGVADRMRLEYGVDQSDQPRLLQLVHDAVGDAPLDLVVDDASHAYGFSRASFGALFPRLADGGIYIIEDWHWSHIPGAQWQHNGGYLPGEPALTNLVAEILMLHGTRPDLVREVRVCQNLAEIVRGDAVVDAPMDLAALTMNRGKPFEPFI